MKNYDGIIHSLFNGTPSKMDFLFEEIDIIHSGAPDRWALSIRNPDGIRVHLAGLIIFTVMRNGIWMSVNPQMMNENFGSHWRWDIEEYPIYRRYKNIEIRNGYLTELSHESWNKIKESHFDVIKSIVNRGYLIGSRTKKNHDNELLLALEDGYGKTFPFPHYSVENEFEDMKRSHPELTEIFKTNERSFQITEKSTIVRARIGQRYYRGKLLKRHRKCMICGMENERLLVSSHIKKWSESNNEERLDVDNGFLLCSNHDALFDKGLISFADSGTIMISKLISKNDLSLLGLEGARIEVVEESKKFLKWHRDKIFGKNR